MLPYTILCSYLINIIKFHNSIHEMIRLTLRKKNLHENSMHFFSQLFEYTLKNRHKSVIILFSEIMMPVLCFKLSPWGRRYQFLPLLQHEQLEGFYFQKCSYREKKGYAKRRRKLCLQNASPDSSRIRYLVFQYKKLNWMICS